MKQTRLSSLARGDVCLVAEVAPEHAELKSRLYALGVIPGSKLEVLRYAPLGDPLQVKVGGSFLSIRKSEADIIKVELT